MNKNNQTKLKKWEITKFNKEDFNIITFEKLQEWISAITSSKNKKQE